MEGDPRLTATAKRLLEDPAQIKLVSVVSGWEIAIKMGTGKLTLALPFKELFPGLLGLQTPPHRVPSSSPPA